jgi:hypothetical protein
MTTSWRFLVPTSAVVALAACTSRGPLEEERGLVLSVGALELSGVADACYTVRVENQQGDLVAERTAVCADRYGDGVGGLSWVGPCDASTSGLPDGDTVNDNRVTLILEDLFRGDLGTNPVARDSYVNPCGVEGGNFDGFGPCQQSVECRENTDTPVRFDLTVLRRANQGFFDVAVNFDDVFCSAKLDCISDPPGLVFDPVSGERIASFVLGFACTSGSEGGTAQPSWMYLSNPVLSCEGLPPMTLELTSVTQDGNQAGVGAVVRWMHMTGEEAVGGGAFDKCYWNLAGGLDMGALAGKDCTLTAQGTAASVMWGDNRPPGNEVHPVIRWSVPVLVDGALCGNHGLDQGGGVATSYVGQATGSTLAEAFDARRRCGPEPEVPSGFACSDSSRLVATTVDGEPGVEVRVGTQSATFRLPEGEGWQLEGCCMSDCCPVR